MSKPVITRKQLKKAIKAAARHAHDSHPMSNVPWRDLDPWIKEELRQEAEAVIKGYQKAVKKVLKAQ